MDESNYNWYYWEADLLDVDALAHAKILPQAVIDEAEAISNETRLSGVFSVPLKKRALAVVAEVHKYEAELKAIRDKEQEDYQSIPDEIDDRLCGDSDSFEG